MEHDIRPLVNVLIVVPIIAAIALAAYLLKPGFKGSSYYRGELLEELFGRLIVGVVGFPLIWIFYFLFLH